MRQNARTIERLATARRLDAEIRERQGSRNRLIVEIARRLAELEPIVGALGFESVQAYAARTLGYSASKTRALVAIARGLDAMPAVRAAAETGELAWTKLRHVVAVASRETESEWLEKARRLSSRKLEEAVASARGEEVLETLRLELTPAQLADVDAGIEAVRREMPAASVGAAVAELCRRAVAGLGVGGARSRVVVTTCAECGAASRETRSGSVAVSSGEVERIACDAEVLDVRKGPAAVRRAMPPRIARFIDTRDRGRCRVPGCKNRAFVERHHEGGWRNVGHDPRRAFLVCSFHHRARHEGALRVEFVADEPHFFLADGTRLDASREEVSREASSSSNKERRTSSSSKNERPTSSRETSSSSKNERPTSSRETSTAVSIAPPASDVLASREARREAEGALRSLGFSVAHASALVSRAAAADPTAPSGVLVRAALQAVPVAS